MGLYDTVGENGIQIKLLPSPSLYHYNVGDEIKLVDGVYFGYGGWFAVCKSRVVAEGNEEQVYNKWGGQISVDIDNYNPITQALDNYKLPRKRL